MAADAHRQDDMPAHAKSYSLFAWLMKWGAVVSLITGLIVIVIISS
ncbi:MAG TPA: aa3-type cytochrome c oxidase subunit IV [Allosphingosinicella sp.]|nr:aa3-type cytochrome c oxidase subunit IV [Allosphingosinicella sp.]